MSVPAARAACLVGLVSILAGCISPYACSVSDGASWSGRAFEVEHEGVGFLMLTSPDMDVTSAVKARCPTGRVSHVVTQGTVRNWFGFVQVYDLTLRGMCDADSRPAAG
ncbi:MAG TPA: hypothetical protein VMI75_13840 [Polyangiaceae bacterium]|nr:hypothetical protein [Polyangiaceae bacterium]